MSFFQKSIANCNLLNEELEPQVTSTDPEERKLARKLRIERRWEALKKSCHNVYEEKSTQGEEDRSEILLQFQKSTELLEKYLLEGEEYVTNVRVANDSREVDRRESEGINKEKVLEQLDEEATAANELFHRVSIKWALIQQQNDPLGINEEIMDQKEKCDMLIKQKDAMIAMLNDELKKAERQFIKDQKKQMEDINTLISQRIEKQVPIGLGFVHATGIPSRTGPIRGRNTTRKEIRIYLIVLTESGKNYSEDGNIKKFQTVIRNSNK